MNFRSSRVLLFGNVLIAVGARAQTGSTSSPAAASLAQRDILRRIEDFGGLKTYAAENAALPAAPANRVVFLGDSITEFWGKKPTFFPGEPYLNRGIAGQTTAQMLIRFRQDVIDLKPAVVIIQGGLTDIAGFTGPSSLVEIEDNLRSMAELASFNHITPILVGAPPPPDYPGRTGPEPAAQIVALNKRVARYCASSHFIFLDYYSALVGINGQMKEGVSDDGENGSSRPITIIDLDNSSMTVKVNEGYVSDAGVNYKIFSTLTFIKQGTICNGCEPSAISGYTYQGVFSGTSSQSSIVGTKWVVTKFYDGFSNNYPDDTLHFTNNTQYTINGGTPNNYTLTSGFGNHMSTLSLYGFYTIGGDYSGMVPNSFVNDGQINSVSFTDMFNTNNNKLVWKTRIQ